MESTIVIAVIAVLGTIAVYLCLRCVPGVRGLERRALRSLRYRLVWRTRITWTGGILLCLYLLGNGALLVYLRENVETWAGVAAAVNSIPLFLGGRSNIVIHCLGLYAHEVIHCTVGLVVIVEGFLRAGFVLARARLNTSVWDFLVSAQATGWKHC